MQCPDNQCSGFGTDSNGNTRWVQFDAFEGGVSGYFYGPDLTNGINIFDGKLYSDANYQLKLEQVYGSQIAEGEDQNDGQKRLYILDESSLASTKQINDFLHRLKDNDRGSIRTTKASLPSKCRATCHTDPRWKRAVNPYLQHTRSSRRPHEAKCVSTRRQKARASADRPRFPPLSPPSRVLSAMRLFTVALDRGFGIAPTMRGIGLSALRQPHDVGEHSGRIRFEQGHVYCRPLSAKRIVLMSRNIR